MAKVKPKSTAIEDLDDLKEHFINKYGPKAVRFAGDTAIVPVDAVPTGVVSIDEAIGCNGIPRGRIIEIYGPESSGKTTTCLKIAAAFQNTMFDIKDDEGNIIDKRRGRVAMVDVEHAFDPSWAKAIGVDVDELIFSQPDNGEQAYDIVEMLVKSGKIELVILDSIAALATKEEIEGTLEGNNQIGANARLNSRALAKIKGSVSTNNCTLMCVNQIREKIGVLFGCLHADTLIPFVDGRVFPIRQVYDEKIEGEVWSFNEKTKEFEPKKIIDWHHNGEVESIHDFIKIEVANNKYMLENAIVCVTPNHEILLKDGTWIKAKDLKVGDRVVTRVDVDHLTYSSVVSATNLEEDQLNQLGKYDLTVADNHNYYAGGSPFGFIVHNSPETTPGGRALKFYASVRMDIRRTGSFKMGELVVGNQTKITFKKNKVAPPFTIAEFNITFGLPEYPISGVDPYSSLIDLAKSKKIITSAGSYLKYDSESLGNGLAAAAAALATDPNLFQKIYNHVVTGTPSCLTTPPSMNEEILSTSENLPQSDS